jgi:hypothetical protein
MSGPYSSSSIIDAARESLAKKASSGVAVEDALFERCQEVIVGQFCNLFCGDCLADDDSDSPAAGKVRSSRPGLISAVEADGNEGNAATPGDGDETGLQRRNLAVARARAFRKDEDLLTRLQPAEGFLEAGQADTVAVDWDRIHVSNEWREDWYAKQSVAGEKIHSPWTRQSDQWRVEHTLMIGADQSAAGGRPVFAALDT